MESCRAKPKHNDIAMFIFDALLDLAMNALEWNRDLTWSVNEIRKSESGMTDKPDRGRNTVSFDTMRKGNIGLCMVTQIARYVKKGSLAGMELTASGMGTDPRSIGMVPRHGGNWRTGTDPQR